MDQQDDIQYDPEVLPPEAGEGGVAPALADDVLPDTLVLLPLPGRPFFPGQVQPVAFNPDNWQATLDAIAQQGSGLLGLAFVDEPEPAKATVEQFPATGCVVR
ncbi:MAG: endopeptidase La, partial [Halieaceae bacterium]